MDLIKYRMMKDENTAYDEVVREIGDFGLANIKNEKTKRLFMQKINQLMRLLNDEEIYEQEEARGCGKDLDMQYPEGRVKCGGECYGCNDIHYCKRCEEARG